MDRSNTELPCPVCCNPLVYERSVFDDRYGYSGVFLVYSCDLCQHKSLNTNFSDEELSELYSHYYPRSDLKLENVKPRNPGRGMCAWLNGEKRSAYYWVPRNVRVLDIGCGFGEALAYHKLRGCDVYGVETDENVQRTADLFGFHAHVGVFAPGIYQTDFFDYVTMDQVVEHFRDPVLVLKEVSSILKKGGQAILSTPNPQGWGAHFFGDRWLNWHAPYHLQFFSPTSMELAANAAGLVVEKKMTITSSEWLYWQWIHLVNFPEEGSPSSFWSQVGSPNHNNKKIMMALSALNRLKINHIFTRFFDSVGFGDNHLFFLRKP